MEVLIKLFLSNPTNNVKVGINQKDGGGKVS